MGNLYVVPLKDTGKVPEMCNSSADVPFSYAVELQTVQSFHRIVSFAYCIHRSEDSATNNARVFARHRYMSD